MRSARLIIILLVLALLGVMLFWGVSYKRSASKPPVSFQLVAVTKTQVRFRVLNQTGVMVMVLAGFQLQETNNSKTATPNARVSIGTSTDGVIHNFDSKRFILSIESQSPHFDLKKEKFLMSLSQPLSTDQTYRVVATCSYRGTFEQRVCSWIGHHARFLGRFVPPATKELATSEWFVVKPEASKNTVLDTSLPD